MNRLSVIGVVDKSLQPDSFLSKETITYWAGMVRSMVSTIEYATETSSGIIIRVFSAAKTGFNLVADNFKQTAYEAAPVLSQLVMHNAMKLVLQDTPLIRLTIGLGFVATGFYVVLAGGNLTEKRVIVGKEVRRHPWTLTEIGRFMMVKSIGWGSIAFGGSLIWNVMNQEMERKIIDEAGLSQLLMKIKSCPSAEKLWKKAERVSGKSINITFTREPILSQLKFDKEIQIRIPYSHSIEKRIEAGLYYIAQFSFRNVFEAIESKAIQGFLSKEDYAKNMTRIEVYTQIRQSHVAYRCIEEADWNKNLIRTLGYYELYQKMNEMKVKASKETGISINNIWMSFSEFKEIHFNRYWKQYYNSGRVNALRDEWDKKYREFYLKKESNQ